MNHLIDFKKLNNCDCKIIVSANFYYFYIQKKINVQSDCYLYEQEWFVL